MKQFTIFMLLISFILTTSLFAQKAGSGMSQAKPEKAKPAQVPVTSEKAPASYPGQVQYTDVDYDLQFEYPCGDASGEAGAESDGNYIYTTKWNGSGFFKYELDGTFLGAFAVGSVQAIRDLAYDGTYMYGGAAATTVYQMDFTTQTLIGTLTAGTATRAIAYDEAEDGFWSNNWSTPIVLWDRTGAVLNTIATAGDESYYGFAYDPQGPYLWGYSQKVGTSQNMLYKMALPAGTLVGSFDMLTILNMPTLGTDIAGGLYFHPDLIQGTNTLGGIVQNICIWGIEMGVSGASTLPSPENLAGEFVSPNSVLLTWSSPQIQGEWLSFCGPNLDGIGLDGGGTFYVAAHWDEAMLNSYDGFYLSKVSIFPNSTLNATYILRVMTGVNGSTLAFQQPVNGLIMKQWNEITLNNPVMINAADHLWVGYQVTHPNWDNPAGLDAGPAVTGYGDMISFDGSFWESMSVSYGLDYNFNIKAYVIENAGSKEFSPLAQTSFLSGNEQLNNGNRAFAGLLGYNIYRDDVLIGTTTTQTTTYTDSDLEPGIYSYKVTALYDEGESEPAGPVSVTVGEVFISVAPEFFEESLETGTSVTRELLITNNGDLPLNYSISIENQSKSQTNQSSYPPNPPDSPEAIAVLNARMQADGLSLNGSEKAPGTIAGSIQFSDEDYDLQFEYPCGDASGEAGAESDGNYIYTTKWNGSGFFKYGLDGTFYGSFQVGTVQAIRDLAFDGTYMYGGAAATTIYQMDFNTLTLVSTMTAGTETRAIAYDEDDDAFYSNNWSTPIVKWSRTGTVLATIPTAGDESYYGLAYDPQGPYLWGYSQKTGTSQNMLYKLDLPFGTVSGSFDMLTILTIPVAGTDIAGGLYFQPDLVQGTNTLGGIVQNKCIWGIEMGTSGPPPTTDVGVQSFVSPVSGPYLGNESVIITVKNYGVNSVSNVPVSYTLNGGAAVTGTFAGPIASGATADFTFPGTVNLGNPGQTYVFVGCTALAGDENSNNNCKTANVTNVIPTYCDATTQVEDEYIANVLCGDINNSSGWQGGVADYTAISTQIDAGMSEDITITNGNAWASDIVYCWADWNKDFTFGTGDEQYMLTNVGGTGQTFTGAIAVPAGTPNGEYRLRIRMTYSTAPAPCGDATYGEIEDYTIVVGGSSNWLTVSPLTGTVQPRGTVSHDVLFDATGINNGAHFANIIIASNATNNPQVNIPAQLFVTGGLPNISLSVAYLDFGATAVGGDSMNSLVVSNTGLETLHIFDIAANNPDFSVLNTITNLYAGTSQTLNIQFSPSSTGSITGVLTILSNDPDTPSIDVDLAGFGYLAPPQNLNGYISGYDVTITWDSPLITQPTGLLGYNIYKDGYFIDFSIVNYFYDLGVTPGNHQYEVSALYDEGESELTPPVFVFAGEADIAVNPSYFEETLEPETSSINEMIITNNGNLPLDFSVSISGISKGSSQNENQNTTVPHSPEAIAALNARMQADGLSLSGSEKAPGSVAGPIQYSDDDYDLQFEYPCGDASGEAGCESDGNYIYTTKWNGSGFFKYGLDGTFYGSFQVGTVQAIRDLAFDGTYIYGGAASTTVYQMDFNSLTLVSTMTAGTATRAIAYDEAEDAFWSNNWSTPIVLWDRTGAVLNTIATAGDESYYGFAYDNQGPYLWGYSQKVGTSQNMLYKMDIATGSIVDEFDVLSILSLPTAGTDIAGGLYFQPDLVQGYNTLGGIVQNICIWGIEMGLTGPPPTTDVGVQSFVSPVSGPYLGNESVIITVKNFGVNSVSNVPVSYTLNGGAAVTGTLAGPIASGATANFTFPGTVNLGNPGQTYVFVGCTALAGDENPNNNCKTSNVTNALPQYCEASTTTEDEYIANVLCGDINNSSGWQGGVADYTAISTQIDAGMSEDITITNGNAWASDIVYCWADWNMDYTFGTGDEQFMLTNVGGTGQTFTGAITVPAGTPGGDYRLRIRMTYSTAPTPCGSATYGEIEEYTIVVGGSSNWLSIFPTSGSVEPGQTAVLEVNFNASGLIPDVYNADIEVLSNDPDQPLIIVPATLTVTEPEPIIADFTAAPLSGSVPLTVLFTDLSSGLISQWAWDFDNDGTVDSYLQNPEWTYSEEGIYSVKLTASNSLTSDQELKTDYITVVSDPTHFIPVWNSPYNPMTFYILAATIDEEVLGNGAEVGLFDIDPNSGEQICVGAGLLSAPLTGGAYLEIIASMDDGSLTGQANGFTPGHEIIYKLWSETTGEASGVQADYPYPGYDEIYSSQGTAFVELNGFTTIAQEISLQTGWNIMSFRVEPDDWNMLNIVQPIINQGILNKVLDEAGGSIFHLPFPPPNGQWSNTIGNMENTEGYYVKVTGEGSLSLEGYPVETPMDIPLTTGWNIISYPCEFPQNALTAVQPLIDAGVLFKVIDEAGGTIFHLPFPPPNGQWSNTIGNFESGEGYYVKVTGNANLNIACPASDNLMLTEKPSKQILAYFNPAFANNPYFPMDVVLKFENEFIAGDEIAVFDGDVCVGASVIAENTDFVIVTCSQDDPDTPETDGFNAGNEILVKGWDARHQQVYENVLIEHISGDSEFTSLGTKVALVTDVILAINQIPANGFSIEIYPNPVTNQSVVLLNLPAEGAVELRVTDVFGKEMHRINNENLPTGSKLVSLSDLKAEPGCYFLKYSYKTNGITTSGYLKFISVSK